MTSLATCSALEIADLPREFLGLPAFVAQAAFTAYWRRQWASSAPPGRYLARFQLSNDRVALEIGLPRRFKDARGLPVFPPPAKELVRMVDRHPRKMEPYLLYARTLAGVTRPGVTYVVGRGTTRTTLAVAVIGFDGKLYVLRGKLAGQTEFGMA